MVANTAFLLMGPSFFARSIYPDRMFVDIVLSGYCLALWLVFVGGLYKQYVFQHIRRPQNSKGTAI